MAEEKSNKEENIYLMSLPCVLANSLIIYSFCGAAFIYLVVMGSWEVSTKQHDSSGGNGGKN